MSCRDLGVTVSHDLKLAVHIEQMVAKAHQCANAMVIWPPQNVRDIEEIEQVQRRFTERLPELKMYLCATRLNHSKYRVWSCGVYILI